MPLELPNVWLGSARELGANGVGIGMWMKGYSMCATSRRACTLWRMRAGSVLQGVTQLPIPVPLAACHGAGKRRQLRNELVSPVQYQVGVEVVFLTRVGGALMTQEVCFNYWIYYEYFVVLSRLP